MRVAVLGAGLSGLTVAKRLAESGMDVEVFEIQNQAGGLAKTLRHGGFTVDLGPHRFHSKDKKLVELVGEWINGNWQVLERRSRIYMAGRFFDYPLRVSNAILTMPPVTSLQIMADYLKSAVTRRILPQADVSFEDWVVNRFGRKLYEIYFKPYNEKLWRIPPNRMSADWASQRISLLNLWDTIVKTVFKGGDEPRTYVSKFNYPVSGGIGSISAALKESVEKSGGKVYLDANVKSIERNKEEDAVTGITYQYEGREHSAKYDLIVSSIPVTSLIRLLSPKPPEWILKKNNKLKFKALIFYYVVVGGKTISDDHWVYIPQKNLIFNRISEPRNFSRNNVPAERNIVCAEISCDVGDDIWHMPEEKMRESVVAGLEELGFMKADEVLECFSHREPHAYPVYDLGYKINLNHLKKYLSGYGNLISLGRNGLFTYDNMDHSVIMGLKAADAVIGSDFREAKKVVEEIARDEEYFG
ncbi:MAG: FAD-dependent oxidoreductase [Candidatus Altiarchaeota archaeon]